MPRHARTWTPADRPTSPDRPDTLFSDLELDFLSSGTLKPCWHAIAAASGPLPQIEFMRAISGPMISYFSQEPRRACQQRKSTRSIREDIFSAARHTPDLWLSFSCTVRTTPPTLQQTRGGPFCIVLAGGAYWRIKTHGAIPILAKVYFWAEMREIHLVAFSCYSLLSGIEV